jgi:ribonuclease M5
MDLQNNIKEVVVVEGYHDLAKLKEIYPQIDCIITNGSEISEETLVELEELNKTRGLILFLDPDYQGERIRRLINDRVGDTKHAFLKKEDCINKKRNKVGIEHANSILIKEALDKTYSTKQTTSLLTMNDLYYYSLIGYDHSKKNRKLLCEELGIGLSNGKTLLKKLNMFNISKEQIEKALGGE